MTPAGRDGVAIVTLWRRDVLALVRQPSRVVGTIATTLLLWVAVGAGIAPSFAPSPGGSGYLTYLFPGIAAMLMLQVSIGATMSVIEDRRQGFLRGVLVAPVSRGAMALGRILGAATAVMVQTALLLLAAPFAGFPLGGVSWGLLAAVVALASVSLAAVGFVLAWLLDSVTGYHVVMNVVLFPLWIVSGALSPTAGVHPAMAAVVRWNPMTYAVAGLRRALHGGALPAGALAFDPGPAVELLVLAGIAVLLVLVAGRVVARDRSRGTAW